MGFITAPKERAGNRAIETHGIVLVYAAFAIAAIAVFLLRPAREAAAWCYFGGWLILPIGIYPPFAHSIGTPIHVMGLALPANMLFSKAAAVATATCVASVICDGRRWIGLRAVPLDFVLAAWCAWPLLRAILSGDPGEGAVPAAYLTCTWGASWVIGRLYFAQPDGASALLKAAAYSGLALLPVAVVELATGPALYGWLFGAHPYATDGIDRYIGYRPLATFEDGNQYGAWMAMAALAGVAIARAERRWRARAVVLVVAALASQSVGAILLLAIGGVALSGRVRVARRWWRATAVATVGVAALYLSGVVPFERIARRTVLGGGILAGFRHMGRGSLPWRISQDQKVMPLVHQHVLIGWGRWDWWMPVGFRPWGLPMLTVGQYGLVGLALMMTVILVAPIVTLARQGIAGPAGATALLVVLSAADAALNSFIFWPAIIAAGALASWRSAADAPNTVDNRGRPLSMPRGNA